MKEKSELFFDAAKKGQLSVVQALSLDPAVNVNFQDPNLDTPLTEACSGNHVEVVKFLLKLSNLDPNLPRLWGVSPLAIACARGNLEVISILLADKRIKVDREDDFGFTPFHHACHKGDSAVVALLLEDPRVNVNSLRNNRTPFYRACECGHVDVVSLLLRHPRVNVNQTNEFGESPFVGACEKGQCAVVALLLEDPRIDVNKHNLDQETPWFSACKKGLVGVVALMVEHPRIRVNEPNRGGEVPLSIASFHGRLSVVKTILAADREIETNNACGRFDSRGKTAAARAQAEGTRPKFGFERDADVKKRVADCPKIVTLLDEYEKDPEDVKKRLKGEIWGPVVGELFALVVYLSDDYLKLPEDRESQAEGGLRNQRFFKLAAQLPMDLQMLLCNRVFGLTGAVVRTSYSERGFRKFAKT